MSPQVVLQNYMFERFLERLSNSVYKDNFILKGGMLIAALVGVESRSTMDMDVTIRNFALSTDSLIKAVTEICSIYIDDEVEFMINGIEKIRERDEYDGYRIKLRAEYDTIITPLAIDVTTGDVITPRELFYSYEMIFEENTIGIWTYNIETVLAEKVETILQRGELNTRLRDYYDIYILTQTQNFDTIKELSPAIQNEEFALQLDNYREFHQAINPLNERISFHQWKEMLCENLDLNRSYILLKDEEVVAYVLCYEGDAPGKIEIGYVGGRNISSLEEYAIFYKQVADLLIQEFDIVEIEADDVDPYASALLNQFTYDQSDSFDAYLFG